MEVSVARHRCALSTIDFPYFFDRAHLEVAGDIRALAVNQLSNEEDHIAVEGPIGLEAERLRCRVLAKKLADVGLFRYCVPARVGGTQVSAPDAVDVRMLCLIREALGWASGVADVVFAMQGLGSYPIVLAGTDEQRAEFLADLARGEDGHA